MPEKPAEISTTPQLDDIPVALRDIPEDDRHFKLKRLPLIMGISGLGAIALLSVVLISLASQSKAPAPATIKTDPSPVSAPVVPANTLLGHLAYEEAPQSALKAITPDGRLKLRKAAAKEFKAMVAAARAKGVILVPISAFRSVSEQQHLFFDIKAQRGQVATKRAEVSAPPGYSEHHTGYATDIGDGNVPAMNLNPRFENTAAFKWLKVNAARFNFEMSFPPNNSQGVTYEPWHWRYVGDRQSLETFYKARNK